MSGIESGQTASRTMEITADTLAAFAAVTGDHNPVHLDEEYAATTPFGRRIAHGLLLGGLISAVFAEELPGPGAIYLSQTLKFKKPAFLGDVITATVEVITVREDKPLVTFKTTCNNQDGDVILEGEAVLLVPR